MILRWILQGIEFVGTGPNFIALLLFTLGWGAHRGTDFEESLDE